MIISIITSTHSPDIFFNTFTFVVHLHDQNKKVYRFVPGVLIIIIRRLWYNFSDNISSKAWICIFQYQKYMYKLYIRLQNYYQVFFFWSHCVARRNTIKLLSGSDRGNQKSLVLQNVINVPGCLEIYETNAINQFAGTAVARHHFSPPRPPYCPSPHPISLSLISFLLPPTLSLQPRT